MFQKYTIVISIGVMFVAIFFMGQHYLKVKPNQNNENSVKEISKEIFDLGKDYKNIIEEKNKKMDNLVHQISKKNEQMNKYQDKIIADKTSIIEAKTLKEKNQFLQEDVYLLERELISVNEKYEIREKKYFEEIEKLKVKISALEEKVKENETLHKRVSLLKKEINLYKIFNDAYIKENKLSIEFIQKNKAQLNLTYKNVGLISELNGYNFYLKIKVFRLDKNGKKLRVFNKSVNIFELELDNHEKLKPQLRSSENLFSSGDFIFEIETIDKKTKKTFKILKVWCEKQLIGNVKITKTEQRNLF